MKSEEDSNNLLWKRIGGDENIYTSKFVSYNWTFPFVTLLWRSAANKEDLHQEMDLRIQYVVDKTKL